jgi:RNA polymerase sigma factor (sigma-70 family)
VALLVKELCGIRSYNRKTNRASAALWPADLGSQRRSRIWQPTHREITDLFSPYPAVLDEDENLSGRFNEMVNGQLTQLLHDSGSAPAPEEQTDSQLLEQFASRQDEAAFAALVKRHGPMVLAVCRRVLRDTNDADDAFQATFLVLVRKAASLMKPELLGNWLYGVAYRVAIKARANAARRSEYERRARAMPLVDPLLDVTGRELRTVLDAEMSRLPEKYRAPLVLCYLEGKTNEEAARQLGWPTGSMSGRLARAREMLRKRLVRRGLALSTGIFVMLLSKNSAAAAVPAALLGHTVHGAVLFTNATAATASAISPSVWTLTQDVLEAMRLSALKKKLTQWLAFLLFALIGLTSAAAAYGAFHGASACH